VYRNLKASEEGREDAGPVDRGPELAGASDGKKIEHGLMLKVISTNICESDQHMVRELNDPLLVVIDCAPGIICAARNAPTGGAFRTTKSPLDPISGAGVPKGPEISVVEDDESA
jgi:hypothetical protein